MFCPKTGSILLPKKEGGKRILVCPKGGKISPTCKTCGFEASGENTKIKETVEKKGRGLEVVDEDSVETLPITDGECDKCGNKQAYYWLIQTRASDEPETKFLRCTKCKHTWRDYS